MDSATNDSDVLVVKYREDVGFSDHLATKAKKENLTNPPVSITRGGLAISFIASRAFLEKVAKKA
jgi:hypothetical protein